MKKIILVAVLATFSLSSFAQKKEMNAAIAGYQKYLLAAQTSHDKAKMQTLLDEAKLSTDKAITDDKTKVLPELWVQRALILGAELTVDSPKKVNVEANLAGIKESLDKAKALDEKGKSKKEIDDAHTNLLVYFNNGGAAAYNAKNFADAYQLFKAVTVYNPNDTTGAYLNAGVSARAANNIDGMVESFTKAIKIGTKDAPALYAELINSQLQVKKDTTAAVALLEEAVAKYPDNVDMVKLQAQIYLNQGNEAKAMAVIDKLITKEPSNPLYYTIKGQTLLNKAYQLQTKRNAVPDNNKAEYDKVNKDMFKLIDDSLPFYEKALSLDAKNVSALEGLKIIYNFKNDETKYKEVKAKLDALAK